jgi:hypothetical protein
VADYRQADAEASRRPFGPIRRLSEQIEDARQHLRGDADAVVSHAHHDFAFLPGRVQPDLAVFVGVLGGVAQQVGQDLG